MGDGEGSGTRLKGVVGKVVGDRHPEYRYGVLLLLLFATFFFIGSAPVGRWTPLATVVILSATLLMALLASGARRLTVTLSLVVIAAGIVAGVVQVVTGGSHVETVTTALTALLVFVAPLTLIRGIIARRKLDLRTVLGALCFYVMIGFFFMFLFNTLQSASGHSFFVQTSHANPADFLYFSFVTMTTTGYGDLTAAHGFGRTLAAFEAMFGQLYLVTVVALLVSNLGPSFVTNRGAGEAAEPVDDGPQAA